MYRREQRASSGSGSVRSSHDGRNGRFDGLPGTPEPADEVVVSTYALGVAVEMVKNQSLGTAAGFVRFGPLRTPEAEWCGSETYLHYRGI